MDDVAFQNLLEEIRTFEAPQGVDLNELLNISAELRQLLVWMLRAHDFQPGDLQTYLDVNRLACWQVIEAMLARRMLQASEDQRRYHIHVAFVRSSRKHRAPGDIWKVFD